MSAALFLCLTAAAHPDPSQKPTARLALPRQYGDCLDCSITASPTVLTGPSAWVSLEITGVRYGFPSDWVGVIEEDDLSAEGALLRPDPHCQAARCVTSATLTGVTVTSP